MVEIMDELHQYVPMLEYQDKTKLKPSEETDTFTAAHMLPLLLGGDQLTVAQARLHGKKCRS